jgi:hypothetical protein
MLVTKYLFFHNESGHVIENGGTPLRQEFHCETIFT